MGNVTATGRLSSVVGEEEDVDDVVVAVEDEDEDDDGPAIRGDLYRS